MQILVTWGSKLGGTEGIARIVGDTLRSAGHDVRLLPADEAVRAKDFDAAIVGGALYAGHWHAAARHFVDRRARDLQRVPVWFFSSGPLDDSADRAPIPPIEWVEVAMERVGALGHATFGGRLPADAKGFPAKAMAKTHAGDFRNTERIRTWANEIARALPTARPRVANTPSARSIPRLLLHGVLGWAICAAAMGALLRAVSPTAAAVLHAIVVPVVFALVARHYFRARGARDALPTAITFVAITALLDLVVVAALAERSLAMFGSVLGTWLPFTLVFLVTWSVGFFSTIQLPPSDGASPIKT